MAGMQRDAAAAVIVLAPCHWPTRRRPPALRHRCPACIATKQRHAPLTHLRVQCFQPSAELKHVAPIV